MGMSTGGKPGDVKSDINVTPLVDVVLVLLIIFLVTMPIVMRTVTLEVPRKAEEIEDVSSASKPIVVCRTGEQIQLDSGQGEKQTIPAGSLAGTLGPILDAKAGEKVVFVDFHPELDWNGVIETMDAIRSLAPAATDTSTGQKDYKAIKVALKKRDMDNSGKDDHDACGCPDIGNCDPEPVQ